jgi:hypothetical protein
MCVLIFIVRGVFIGVQGVTDFAKWWPDNLATGLAGHLVRSPPTFSTALVFPFSCRHVYEAAGQTDIKPGRSATLWAHWSAAFAHCLLVSGTSWGDTYFSEIPNFLIIF